MKLSLTPARIIRLRALVETLVETEDRLERMRRNKERLRIRRYRRELERSLWP